MQASMAFLICVAFMAEHVGGAPQQLLARGGLVLLGVLHHDAQAALELGQRGSLVHHVDVVEAVIRNLALRHELESGVHLVLRPRDGVGALVPGERLRAAAELVGALGAQRVPVSHRETQVLLQGLTHHHLVLVVIMKRQRILRLASLERDLANPREKFSLTFKITHNRIVLISLKMLFYEVPNHI